MITVGQPPYLECSSRGDKRFSAFHAYPRVLMGSSIEQAYQSLKLFEDGTRGLSWRKAKGRKPVNLEECHRHYVYWWEMWIQEMNLLPVLKAASGLSDIFGQKGHICQAIILWDIRNKGVD